jgi:hypothetical protein
MKCVIKTFYIHNNINMNYIRNFHANNRKIKKTLVEHSETLNTVASLVPVAGPIINIAHGVHKNDKKEIFLGSAFFVADLATIGLTSTTLKAGETAIQAAYKTEKVATLVAKGVSGATVSGINSLIKSSRVAKNAKNFYNGIKLTTIGVATSTGLLKITSKVIDKRKTDEDEIKDILEEMIEIIETEEAVICSQKD